MCCVQCRRCSAVAVSCRPGGCAGTWMPAAGANASIPVRPWRRERTAPDGIRPPSLNAAVPGPASRRVVSAGIPAGAGSTVEVDAAVWPRKACRPAAAANARPATRSAQACPLAPANRRSLRFSADRAAQASGTASRAGRPHAVHGRVPSLGQFGLTGAGTAGCVDAVPAVRPGPAAACPACLPRALSGVAPRRHRAPRHRQCRMGQCGVRSAGRSVGGLPGACTSCTVRRCSVAMSGTAIPCERPVVYSVTCGGGMDSPRPSSIASSL